MIWRAPLSDGCNLEVGKALKNLELLLAIASSNYYAFLVLPTSRVHPKLNGAHQIMNHFFNLYRRCKLGHVSPDVIALCSGSQQHLFLQPRYSWCDMK